jgi:hypothetical protein
MTSSDNDAQSATEDARIARIIVVSFVMSVVLTPLLVE